MLIEPQDAVIIWICSWKFHVQAKMTSNIEIRAACYGIEKWEIQKIAGEGAGKSAAKLRGAGGSAGEGAAPHSFPRKAPLAAPSPALPPAPRSFAALFPAPSPAIFWISPFLYSVAGRPDLNSNTETSLAIRRFWERARKW